MPTPGEARIRKTHLIQIASAVVYSSRLSLRVDAFATGFRDRESKRQRLGRAVELTFLKIAIDAA